MFWCLHPQPCSSSISQMCSASFSYWKYYLPSTGSLTLPTSFFPGSIYLFFQPLFSPVAPKPGSVVTARGHFWKGPVVPTQGLASRFSRGLADPLLTLVQHHLTPGCRSGQVTLGVAQRYVTFTISCLKGVEWSLVSSLLGRGVLNLGSVMRWCTYSAQEQECCRELCQCFSCGGTSGERVPDALPCWVHVLGTSAFHCWEASKHYCKCKLFLRLSMGWSIIVWCACSPNYFDHPSEVTWSPRRDWQLNLGFLCSNWFLRNWFFYAFAECSILVVWATVKQLFGKKSHVKCCFLVLMFSV